MMTKDLILQTAMKQYAAYGIKSVSMDEIARNLRISKRTLYTNFKDKEELLYESLKSETAKLLRLLEKCVEEATSPLEALLRFKQEAQVNNISLCAAFHRDLPRFAKAYNEFIIFKNQMYRRCKELLRQSIDQGLLVKDRNYGLIARLYSEDTENSASQYEIIFMLLWGSCTVSGKLEIDHFQHK